MWTWDIITVFKHTTKQKKKPGKVFALLPISSKEKPNLYERRLSPF